MAVANPEAKPITVEFLTAFPPNPRKIVPIPPPNRLTYCFRRFSEADVDDKEKSVFDSFADTIKNTFDIATEAAKKALEPEPLKPDEEVVVVPAPPDGMISDLTAPSPPMVAIVKKKPRKKSAVNTSGRITPVYDIPVPDTPMPAPKKKTKKASKKPASKKASKKSHAKSAKKSKRPKKAPKKSASRVAKKAAKKPSRGSAVKKNVKKKKKAKGGR
jgi:hypothetical protein